MPILDTSNKPIMDTEQLQAHYGQGVVRDSLWISTDPLWMHSHRDCGQQVVMGLLWTMNSHRPIVYKESPAHFGQ